MIMFWFRESLVFRDHWANWDSSVGFRVSLFHTHKEEGSTMIHRIAVGGVMAALALASAVVAADAVKSGPQPGDTVRAPFDVANVTGKFAPKKMCLV